MFDETLTSAQPVQFYFSTYFLWRQMVMADDDCYDAVLDLINPDRSDQTATIITH